MVRPTSYIPLQCVHGRGVEVSQLGFIRSESIGSLPLTVILAIIHSETEDNHGFAVSDDSLPTATHLLDRHSIGNRQSSAATKDIPEIHLHNRIRGDPQLCGGNELSVGLGVPLEGEKMSHRSEEPRKAEGCPRLMAGPPVE